MLILPAVLLYAHRLQVTVLPFYFHCAAACLYSALPSKQCVLFTRAFTHRPIALYLVTLILSFLCFLSLSPPSSGKSVVSEPEDEVQATEVGGGGLRVSAEEERIASHKPVETGDQTVEPRGNWCHFGRLKKKTNNNKTNYISVWLKEDLDKWCRVETVRGFKANNISDLRRSAAEGERNPAGGTAVTALGLSVQMAQEDATDSVSVHLPEPFHAPTTTTATTTISYLQPPNFTPIHIGRLHFRGFFFF